MSPDKSNPMYGKHHSRKTRKKMSEAMQGKYKNEDNPMWGKHHSEKTREKMRKKALGRIPWNKGKKGFIKLSDKTKKIMSAARIGKNNAHWKGGYSSGYAQRIWHKWWRQNTPEGYAIHHVDGNRRNNDITNLALVTCSEHARIHNRRRGKNVS